MVDEKFLMTIDKDNLILTNKERGIFKLNLLTYKIDINPTCCKYNTTRKYFIGYSIGGRSYSQMSLSSNIECEDDVKEYKNIFYYIKKVAGSNSYNYSKTNFGNIMDDYNDIIRSLAYSFERDLDRVGEHEKYHNETLDECKERLKRKAISDKKQYDKYVGARRLAIDVMNSDLNYRVESFNYHQLVSTKFRKDVRRILVKYRVKIDKRLIDFKDANETDFNNLILILDNEKMFNNYRDDYDRETDLGELFYYWSDIKRLRALGYDLKAVFQKTFNYYTIYEGLYFRECIKQLRDYADMHQQMGITKFVKYPKFLRSNHDIIQAEFRQYKQEIDEAKFKEQVNTELEWKHKDFAMIAPETSEDLKREGKLLNHCVGSYIKRVSDGMTQILFLRHKEDFDEPKVTVEVKEDVIIQAKGMGNRAIGKHERTFLEKYAEEKKLLLRV